MNPDERFVELVTRAHEYLTLAQDRLRAEFALGDHQRWHWDVPGQVLEFASDDEPQVVAHTRVVGSVSSRSGTWLWGWANPNLDPASWRDLLEVRRFGEQHDIWQLRTPKWEADETDGWEMTSIAAHVLHAEGAYRLPYPDTLYYLILDEIRWVNPR